MTEENIDKREEPNVQGRKARVKVKKRRKRNKRSKKATKNKEENKQDGVNDASILVQKDEQNESSFLELSSTELSILNSVLTSQKHKRKEQNAASRRRSDFKETQALKQKIRRELKKKHIEKDYSDVDRVILENKRKRKSSERKTSAKSTKQKQQKVNGKRIKFAKILVTEVD
ncbi:hypothetical protein PCE1_002064 [Barthelona sp. PCE]